MKDMYYVVQSSVGMRVVPHSKMMYTDPEDVWYSSELEIECHAFIQQFCEPQEQDCDNNGGNCDDYLLEPSCDQYNDWN